VILHGPQAPLRDPKLLRRLFAAEAKPRPLASHPPPSLRECTVRDLPLLVKQQSEKCRGESIVCAVGAAGSRRAGHAFGAGNSRAESHSDYLLLPAPGSLGGLASSACHFIGIASSSTSLGPSLEIGGSPTLRGVLPHGFVVEACSLDCPGMRDLGPQG
jgi:hypothetical protein